MSAPAERPPRGARRFPQPQGFAFWIIGDQRAVLRDAYHTFLKMRWSASLALISIGLLVSNLLFATAFYATGGVAGTDGSFFDMFVFSVETMATIGYGVMNPVSTAAHGVMIVEAIFGIIVVALATGLVFYTFNDVRFGHRLADTISPLANGDLVLDLTKFDVIEPDPHVSVAA